MLPIRYAPSKFDCRIDLNLRVEICSKETSGCIAPGNQIVDLYSEPSVSTAAKSPPLVAPLSICGAEETVVDVISKVLVLESAGGPEVEFPSKGLSTQQEAAETNHDYTTKAAHANHLSLSPTTPWNGPT